MSHVYYSYRVEDEKNIAVREHEIVFGKAHYSYKIAARKFLKLLSEYKYNIHELIRPEMYKHESSFKTIPYFNFYKTNNHLIFKPIEHINILKNSNNIGVFAWEFDKIIEEDIDNNPFINQKRMLSLLDEIWVPSSYTQKVLKTYGFDKTYFIPAPIIPHHSINEDSIENLIGDSLSLKLHSLPVNQEKITSLKNNIDLDQVSKTYMAILNPWDYRKNIVGLLRTFQEFATKHSDVLFLIKVIIDNKTTHLNNINEILYLDLGGEDLKSDNIFFISEYLSDDLLYSLYKSVDYYYNLSFAEGQFLPILEAMSVGTVAISPDSTAMGDYINSENSFVVPSRLVKCNPKSNAFQSDQFNWYEPDLSIALEQLEYSYQITKDEYEDKSKKAIKKVQEVYGIDAIFKKIKARLDEK